MNEGRDPAEDGVGRAGRHLVVLMVFRLWLIDDLQVQGKEDFEYTAGSGKREGERKEMTPPCSEDAKH